MKHAILHANGVLLRGLAIISGIVAVLWIAPEIGEIEGRMFPVVTDFRLVNAAETQDGQLAATVEFTKARHCQFIDNNWLWRNGRYWLEAELTYPEDKGHAPDNKPLGTYQATWLLDIPWVKRAAPMRIVAHHYCHGSELWITDTVSEIQPDTEAHR